MKLFTPPPEPDLIRINITQKGQTAEHIAVFGCNIDQCIEEIKAILIWNEINPFPQGNYTNIACRESNAGENGNSKSFRVYNLSPQTIKQYILTYLNQ